MVADNTTVVREIDYTKKLPDAEYEVMQAICNTPEMKRECIFACRSR